MTDLPKIPKSAIAVLEIAGVRSLEDCATWPADELAALRGFGPKAFATVQASMTDAGLSFDATSGRRAEPINVAMAEERMKGAAPDPSGAKDLPNIGRPARRALAAIGVYNMADLEGRDDADLLALHGFGPKALRLIRDAQSSLR